MTGSASAPRWATALLLALLCSLCFCATNTCCAFPAPATARGRPQGLLQLRAGAALRPLVQRSPAQRLPGCGSATVLLGKEKPEIDQSPISLGNSVQKSVRKFLSTVSLALSGTLTISAVCAGAAVVETAVGSESGADSPTVVRRGDVGFIDLNATEPVATNVAWLDVTIGGEPGKEASAALATDPQRVEISLYGDVVPVTVRNFLSLCRGEGGVSYKGSDFFRVISEFSVQAGNVGCPANAPPSRVGRYGRVSQGLQQDLGQGVNGFPPENFRILHGYREAGVVSMMKDNTNKGLQDSRFFVTLKPDASWADGKYVAFGRVSKGLELIQAMAVVPVEPPANYPLSRIRIVDCGVY